MQKFNKIKRWFDERLGLDFIKTKLLYKPISEDIGWWYTLGSICLFLFLIQAITGIILACIYVPTLENAYESVEYIQNEMVWGWLVRGIHHWGSNLMVIVVFIHMVRVFFHGSYKKPNEVTWITGVFLMILTASMALTGYILPWSDRSYWAATILSTIFDLLPLVGSWLANVVGGIQTGGVTIGRYCAFHMLLIPLMIGGIIAIHILLIQLHGEKGPPPKGDREVGTRPFFPYQLSKDVIAALLMLILLIVLARYAGVPPDPPAAPLADVNAVPKPEWFILFGYEILKMFTGKSIIIALTVLPFIGISLILLLPFYDRNEERAYAKRPIVISCGVAALILVGYLTLIAHISSPLPGKFFAPDRPLEIKELAGMAIFEKNVCYCCHSIKGVGMKHAPDLWRVGLKQKKDWLEKLLKDPDKTIGKKGKMVKYYLNQAEIDALVAYLGSLDFHNYKAKKIEPPVFRGAYAFYQLDCLSCHKIGKEGSGEDLVKVVRSKSKEALADYLIQDKNHNLLIKEEISKADAENISALLTSFGL